MRRIELDDYAGYDPYDALNSRFLRRMTGRSKWSRIAAIQALRRCPINLRPVLGIARGHNPKGIGLCLWGYAKLCALEGPPQHLDQIDRLLDLLEQLRCAGYSGHCWGYNFDWQSRTFLRPKGTPTIVNTAFIGHALLDCYEMTGRHRALELALPIKEFILNDLHRIRCGETFCFSYTPVDTEAVHNANLLGASILARLARYGSDGGLAETASMSLAYSMRRQQADGSWFYAETAIQRWIDSFHTGFNLQAIRYLMQAGLAEEWRPAYCKGVAYYANQFFLRDGTPKYYHDRVYPIDIHSPAQAISFFSQEGEEYAVLTDRIANWMLDHMYGGRGAFYFRRGRFAVNRIPYMRWSQAWAFHALAEYVYWRSERSPHGGDGTTCRTTCPGRADKLFSVAGTRRGVRHGRDQERGKDLLCGHQS